MSPQLQLNLGYQTNTAAYTSPTFTSTTNDALVWPEDPFKPSKPEATTTRPDRPRLIAPAYKWQALPKLIKGDPYLKGWNNTIFGNASEYYPLPPVQYNLDGGNGILDNSREIKMRIKAFAYVYHMTNDTKWVDRTWTELQASRQSTLYNSMILTESFRMLREMGRPHLVRILTDGTLAISLIQPK